MAYLRVGDAGRILGIKPVTVRKWCREGKLKSSRSAAGHRIFDEEYILEKKRELIKEPPTKEIKHSLNQSPK